MINNNELSKLFELKTGLKFEVFFSKYRPKLVWYLTRYTKDQEKAADFADDAFTQALLKIGNYNQDKSQVHTWVYKIGENLVKKDYKDRKRMFVFSLDKENSDNLNLMNVLPQIEDTHNFEGEIILDKKADLVKESIFNLPNKYKKVMIMRELENKPYLEIAELCTKDYTVSLNKNKVKMPDPSEFLDLFIENKGKDNCYINFEYNEDKKVQMKVLPGQTFKIDKHNVQNIEKITPNIPRIVERQSMSNMDAYFLITLLYKDKGISFLDISKVLTDNNLREYLYAEGNTAIMKRASFPEYKSCPARIKRFVYDENKNVYTPLFDYFEENKEYVLDNISILLEHEISDSLKSNLTELLNTLSIKNNVEVCNISFNEDDEVVARTNIFASIEIEAKDKIDGMYRTTTNLSTIKSQISKGRQLIQSMVSKKFKYLEDNGIDE
jgi:RNA polymerase sigma-70 factor (ECF subfamily)